MQQPCVLLLRGGSKATLENQERACRTEAEEKSIEVRAVFREREKLVLQRRKVLRWLRAYCQSNDVRLVIAFKEASISRNASELFLIKLLLGKAGISLVFAKETKHPNF